MTFTSEHHRDLRQGLIRIPKSEMKEFEIRNWKRGFVLGDFWQLKQANIDIICRSEMMDFKGKSFYQTFLRLETTRFFSDYWQIKGHSDRQLPQKGISECSIQKTTQYSIQLDYVQDWNDCVVFI